MTSGLKMVNEALRFLLELAALAVFAYWGFAIGPTLLLRVLFGIGLPVLFAFLWGWFASPRARVKLSSAARVGVEIIFFGLAAAALADIGQPVLAIFLAVLYAVNWILLVRWGQW